MAGTTKLKAEVYKAMGENLSCTRAMTESLNGVLDEQDIPECWKTSWMRLIKKVQKPTAKDFRPITITNISYKIYMSFIRKEIEEHLERNNVTKDNQIGFTGGGRAEYNHFVLQYLIDRAYQKREKLIILALDFKKAFDSIDRRRLIDALIEYRINPYIIDLAAKIYSNDRTKICMDEEDIEMSINSGIKQGCTASTAFFKIITYMIMNAVEEKGEEYEIEGLKLSTLFFADDSTALARTEEAAKTNLKIIVEASAKFGLHINREKSSVMICNNDRGTTEIDGIEVTEKMKYLGIEVESKRDMYKKQKGNMMEKADRLEPRTYSTIKKSCDKLLIGKSYWKGAVLPTVLYGAGLYNVTKAEVKRLQTKENDCYRTILGARKNTANAALRGEIGSSLMETRFIESKLMLVHSILNGKNELVKEILKRVRRDGNNTWNKSLEDYLKKVNLRYEDIGNMNQEDIKKSIRKRDNELWEKEIATKSSLSRYRRFKKKIRQENIYDNRFESRLLFKARTGTLELNTDKRHKNEVTTCDLCETEEETDVHFILKCRRLRDLRKSEDDKYKNKTKEETMGEMLFGKGNEEDTKVMLGRLWRKREVLRKRKQRATLNVR